MANEKRLRALAVGGLVEDNPLTAVATTVNSAGLAALVAVASTEHAAIVFDPDGVFGAPEIAYVTAHAAAATSATIARGQEGTTARQHDRDVPWIHGPTVKDFDGAGGGSGLIGVTSYKPGSLTPVAAPGAGADVDATNLVLAATVPPSGKVLVSLSAHARSITSANYYEWGIRVGAADVEYQGVGFEFTQQQRVTARILLTGRTPGVAESYKWAHRTAGASSIVYGGAAGAAVMEAWAVNV